MNRILSLVFSAMIALPVLQMLLPVAPEDGLTEKRIPRAAPGFRIERWREFPREFEDYFEDQFGFRSVLVRVYHRIKIRAVTASTAVSPVTHEVIIGRDGWLFYNRFYEHEPGAYEKFYGEDQLQEARRRFQEIQDEMTSKGILFFAVIAPNKSSIYPEYLPESIRPGRQGLDQLTERLLERPPLNLLDLKPALLDGKKLGRVYDKADTHWSALGAYFAYRAILEKIAEKDAALVPLKLSDFEITTERKAGDLAEMLSLSDRFAGDSLRLQPKSGAAPKKSRLKIMIFHDSFQAALNPYLKLHFESLECRQPAALTAETDAVKPDVVIWLFGERFQHYLFNG